MSKRKLERREQRLHGKTSYADGKPRKSAARRLADRGLTSRKVGGSHAGGRSAAAGLPRRMADDGSAVFWFRGVLGVVLRRVDLVGEADLSRLRG
jgi:hypothetical protein